jgi:dolichol kinase
MVLFLISLAPVGLILLLSEFLWRKKIVKGERARKFIHILAGMWMAFWPFYISFKAIAVFGALATVVLIYSRLTRLFHAIYAVKRRTYGDILFAITLVLCALLGQEPWIFTVSILFMALADGGAAVVGRYYGINNQYFVFGKRNLRKSIAGTAAYVVLAYVSIAIGYTLGGQDVMQSYVVICFLFLPFSAALLENVTPYGIDNLAMPLFATLLLNSLL